MAKNNKTLAEPQHFEKNVFHHLCSIFCIVITAILTATSFMPPEGDIREGDFLPLFLLLLLFVSLSLFALHRSHFLQTNSIKSLKSKLKIRYRTADVALGLFFLWMTVSYLKIEITGSADRRLASNGFWTFASPVFFYFFLRYIRYFLSTNIIHKICIVLFILAVSESIWSIYSYTIVNPRLRAAYQADPETILKENNLSFEENSSERLLFENRLLNSTEPTGTFGLANTLAGFLVPILLLSFVFFPRINYFSKKVDFHSQWRNIFAYLLFLFGLGIILFVLIITKSRSGVLSLCFGSICGLSYLTTEVIRRQQKISPYFILGTSLGILVILLGVGVAFLTGILDTEVFTEAGKSLGYRLDYWQATLSIITSHPWCGIGPGEFQNIYSSYILPTASEFIADPHNFLFEITALFGIPGICFFLMFLVTVVFIGLGEWMKKHDESLFACSSDNIPSSDKPFFVGFLIGLCFLYLVSYSQVVPVDHLFLLTALCIFIINIPVIKYLGKQEIFPISTLTIVLSIVLVSTLVNLCVAGGIGYPNISLLCSFFAASIVNLSEIRQIKNFQRDNNSIGIQSKINQDKSKSTMLVLLFSILTLLVFYYTAFKPHTNAFLFSLKHTPEIPTNSPYKEILEKNAFQQIDPYSAPIAAHFYNFAVMEYVHTPSPQNHQRWEIARSHILKVSPNSSSLRESCGDLDRLLYSNSQNQDLLHSAIDFYRESVSLSPTESEKHAKLAVCLLIDNRFEEARNEAKTALSLDALTPHKDRKLSIKMKTELQKISKQTPDYSK